MYSKLEAKLIHQARMLAPYSDGVHKHVSFLVHRNRILSIGINKYAKSHPLSAKFGYFHASIHSELNAIVNFPKQYDIKRCRLYNIRVKAGDIIGMSAPCKTCQKLIIAYDIRDVLYTTDNGDFREF